MSKVDELLARVGDEAEANESRTTPLRDMSEVRVTRGHGRSKTLQVRLNEDEYEMLEKVAKLEELPVSTVARGILVRAVKQPADDLRSALADLSAATDRVKRLGSQG